MISPDPRVHAVNLLFVVGIVGHTVEFCHADPLWQLGATAWLLPGWHQLLPEWLPMAVAGALLVCAVALAMKRSRFWAMVLCCTYVVQHLTWPVRVRNHMMFMLVVVVMQAAIWLATGFPRDVRRRLQIDASVANGWAILLILTYAFGGFHKLNTAFLALDPELSHGASTVARFVSVVGVGHPPAWLLAIGTYGTIVVEMAVPFVAWRFRRARVPAVLFLLAFHFPMISTMGVSDYPMLVSALFPALFEQAEWAAIARRLRAPSRWEIGGAMLAGGVDVFFSHLASATQVFGFVVALLWGYAAVALVRETYGSTKPSLCDAEWLEPSHAASV